MTVIRAGCATCGEVTLTGWLRLVAVQLSPRLSPAKKIPETRPHSLDSAPFSWYSYLHRNKPPPTKGDTP